MGMRGLISAKKNAPAKESVDTQPYFTPEGLRFLRGLSRNNNRDWFNGRKPIYEAEIKRPMLAVIDAVTGAMMDFAPGHVRAPESIMMRIYRDTRFSKEKLPYKTHVAAWWVHDGLAKTSGAGFYLHVSAKQVEIAAGAFMPNAEQLLAIRRYLMEHHQEYRKLAQARALRRLLKDEESGDTIEPVAKGVSGRASGGGALPAEALGVQRIARARDGNEAGICEDGGELFSSGGAVGCAVEPAVGDEDGEAAEAAVPGDLSSLITSKTAAKVVEIRPKSPKKQQKHKENCGNA